MSPFDIEDQIRKAQQNGEFDRLRGAGKPLTHLDTDPFEHLVKEQGFKPHWLDLDHEIRAKIEIARQSVQRTCEWVIDVWSSGGADKHFAQEEWRKAQHIFAERIAEINQLIKTFNLELPEAVRHRQKFPLKLEEELQHMGLTVKW